MKQRVALLVYVDLDPVPGTFHTDDSARNTVAAILEGRIDHYNPLVSHAPGTLQPPNHPSNTDISQEIPKVVVVTPGPPNVYDVTNYGADVTGVNDSSPALTAALLASANREIPDIIEIYKTLDEGDLPYAGSSAVLASIDAALADDIRMTYTEGSTNE